MPRTHSSGLRPTFCEYSRLGMSDVTARDQNLTYGVGAWPWELTSDCSSTNKIVCMIVARPSGRGKVHAWLLHRAVSITICGEGRTTVMPLLKEWGNTSFRYLSLNSVFLLAAAGILSWTGPHLPSSSRRGSLWHAQRQAD